MKKNYKNWFKKKEKFNNNNHNNSVYFRKKEMWWCALGCNIGFEQDGKNENFERPVLILKKISRHLVLVVPLSTQIKREFRHYCEYEHGGKEYSALLLQIRVVSSKRLLRRIDILEKEEFYKLMDKVLYFVER